MRGRIRHCFRRIELDERLAGLDAIADVDVDGGDLAGIERFDHLDAPDAFDFALGDRVHVEPANKRPSQRRGEEQADRHHHDDGQGRGRSFEDLERRGQKLAIAPGDARLRERRALRRLGFLGESCAIVLLPPAPIAIAVPTAGDRVRLRAATVPVAAYLDDFTLHETDDARARPDRREPVGDDEHRAALGDRRHVVLDDALALIIERRGRFVEDEYARVGRQRPRDRDALALPAGKVGAALFDDGIVALWQLGNQFVGAGEFCGIHHARARHGGIAERDVFVKGAIEQNVLLQHHADLAAQPPGIELRDVDAVEHYLSHRGIEAQLAQLRFRALLARRYARVDRHPRRHQPASTQPSPVLYTLD